MFHFQNYILTIHANIPETNQIKNKISVIIAYPKKKKIIIGIKVNQDKNLTDFPSGVKC